MVLANVQSSPSLSPHGQAPAQRSHDAAYISAPDAPSSTATHTFSTRNPMTTPVLGLSVRHPCGTIPDVTGCVFCQIISGELPRRTSSSRPTTSFAFLDARPVFKGHVLLVPREHVETLPDLPAEARDGFLAAAQQLATAVKDGLGAQGSFVAINNTVSQSVPHLHLHVVPRTKGDGLRGFFWPRTKYADGEAERRTPTGCAPSCEDDGRQPRGARTAASSAVRRDVERGAERPGFLPSAQGVAGGSCREDERGGADGDPRDHVDEEVPAQVDRRHHGEREEGPGRDADEGGEPHLLRPSGRW